MGWESVLLERRQFDKEPEPRAVELCRQHGQPGILQRRITSGTYSERGPNIMPTPGIPPGYPAFSAIWPGAQASTKSPTVRAVRLRSGKCCLRVPGTPVTVGCTLTVFGTPRRLRSTTRPAVPAASATTREIGVANRRFARRTPPAATSPSAMGRPHFLTESIDYMTYQKLGDRRDGYPVEGY